ncbi:MAG: glycosyltransferase [Gemmatimonadales bacterium]|nr:MAG: glycosyltransferase [Gemmatimonadales bacterium]
MPRAPRGCTRSGSAAGYRRVHDSNGRKALRQSDPVNTVSVIIPSWNKQHYIEETIDSALGQQGVGVEVVVVDDGSTDRSVEILKGYGSRILLHCPGENAGAARARNIGAALASGTHFMFLDADDVLGEPDTLSSLVGALAGRTDRFAACPWQRLRLDGDDWKRYSPEKPLAPPGGDPISAWLGNWYIPTCAILWPRELFEASGGWDPDLAVTNDEELMIRTLLRGASIATVSRGEALYRYFESGGTLSTTPSRRLAAHRLESVRRIAGEMADQGLLPRYAHDLGRKYARLSRTYLHPFPDLSIEALSEADRHLDPTRLEGSPLHRMMARSLGLARKERISRWMAGRGVIRRAPPSTPA